MKETQQNILDKSVISYLAIPCYQITPVTVYYQPIYLVNPFSFFSPPNMQSSPALNTINNSSNSVVQNQEFTFNSLEERNLTESDILSSFTKEQDQILAAAGIDETMYAPSNSPARGH